MITETWNMDESVQALTHWACGRPMAQWKGAYPEGFLQRLDKTIGLSGKKVLTLFCGSSNFGDTVDIKPEANPTYLADCRKALPIPDKRYDVIIADPPYDSQNITYSDKLYKERIVRPYSFVKEAVRITVPGGYVCILHQLVYKTLEGTQRHAVIPITTGPNQRIRVLNIFKRLEDAGSRDQGQITFQVAEEK